MNPQINLKTNRLLLKPFTIDDAGAVQSLAGNKLVAEMTESVPHPYPDGAAILWINSENSNWLLGRSAAFAIHTKKDLQFIGCISLININKKGAELGYWLGQPFWGKGYCTEASISIIDLAFNQLNLIKIYASHLTNNPASGHVLKNAGFHEIGKSIISNWRGSFNVSIQNYKIICPPLNK